MCPVLAWQKGMCELLFLAVRRYYFFRRKIRKYVLITLIWGPTKLQSSTRCSANLLQTAELLHLRGAHHRLQSPATLVVFGQRRFAAMLLSWPWLLIETTSPPTRAIPSNFTSHFLKMDSLPGNITNWFQDKPGLVTKFLQHRALCENCTLDRPKLVGRHHHGKCAQKSHRINLSPTEF